jgi:hypothetical protein
MDSTEFRTSKFVISDKAFVVSSDKVVEAVTLAAVLQVSGSLFKRRT